MGYIWLNFYRHLLLEGNSLWAKLAERPVEGRLVYILQLPLLKCGKRGPLVNQSLVDFNHSFSHTWQKEDAAL